MDVGNNETIEEATNMDLVLVRWMARCFKYKEALEKIANERIAFCDELTARLIRTAREVLKD